MATAESQAKTKSISASLIILRRAAAFWGFVSTLFAHKPKIAVPILTVERKRQRSTSRLIRRANPGRNSDYHGAISLPRAGRYLL